MFFFTEAWYLKITISGQRFILVGSCLTLIKDYCTIHRLRVIIYTWVRLSRLTGHRKSPAIVRLCSISPPLSSWCYRAWSGVARSLSFADEKPSFVPEEIYWMVRAVGVRGNVLPLCPFVVVTRRDWSAYSQSDLIQSQIGENDWLQVLQFSHFHACCAYNVFMSWPYNSAVSRNNIKN